MYVRTVGGVAASDEDELVVFGVCVDLVEVGGVGVDVALLWVGRGRVVDEHTSRVTGALGQARLNVDVA